MKRRFTPRVIRYLAVLVDGVVCQVPEPVVARLGLAVVLPRIYIYIYIYIYSHAAVVLAFAALARADDMSVKG